MKLLKFLLLFLLLAVILVGDIYLLLNKERLWPKIINSNKNMPASENLIKLPSPRQDSSFSLENALFSRRSVREYGQKKISLAELSQILWAAQGITSGTHRTTPSAGALYPLEVYVVGSFEDYAPGLYHYVIESHALEKIKDGDFRQVLAEAALGQEAITLAPLDLVITGVYERTTSKYGERGERYVAMEAGHAGQNIYLQAEALGLGTVSIGAFDDEKVSEILRLASGETPFYIFPIGHKK